MLKRLGLARGQFLYLCHPQPFPLPRLRILYLCRHTASTSVSRNPDSSSQYTKPAPNPPLPPDLVNHVEKILSNNTADHSVIKRIQASPELLRYITNHESARKIAEGLACTRHPLQSLRFLQVARLLECKLKDNAYECVAFCLAKKKNWDGVLSAVSLAEQHRGRLSSRLLNWRTRAQVEIENPAALQHTLDEFKEHQVEPTRRTYHLILSGHIRNRNLSVAKECLEAMSEAGYPPDASTHAIVATHYRRLGTDPDVETQALRALPDLKPVTGVAVLNSLITLRLDVHDLNGALQLSSLFHKPHIDPILAIMASGRDVNHVELASLDHVPIVLQPLVPNAATYSIFINYQASRSNLHGALQIFRTMLMDQVQVTPGVFASLVYALYIGGKGDIAVRMVANMCSTAGVPSPLFERLLSSQNHEGLPWVPSGITPTVRVFNAFLKGVLSTHGLEGMETILRIMHDCDVKPTAATLEILMNHIKRVEHGHARVLSRILRDLFSSDVQPTMRHMHIIFSSVLRTERNLVYGFGWDNVAAKFSSSREAQPRPYPTHRISTDADLFDPVAGIELPKALRHRQLTRPSIESLQSRNILSDSPMLALRIKHDSLIRSELDSAKEIFDAMLDRGIHPNEYHYSALMEGFTRAGDVEGALDVMESASRAGFKPNVVMFTIIIVGYAHKGNPDKAIRVFEDMISSGVAPDVPSIDAVASAFFMIGAYEMAKNILRTMWTYIEPFPSEFAAVSLKRLAQGFRLLHKEQRYGDFGLSKDDRLALHLKLNRLKALWNTGKLWGYKRRINRKVSGRHTPQRKEL